ncbi:MAG: acetate--CoA ligase [Desulfuromusa sp.]
MNWPPIKKNPSSWRLPPNLIDYQQACSNFSWDAVRNELDGLPDGRGLNIAYEAVDRHVNNVEGEKIALRWLGKKGQIKDFSYAELKAQSNRFANILRSLEVGKGERVFSLSGRIPELYFAIFGTLKNTSVFCPLFSAFGPEPIAQRLERGDARVLVTTERLYRKKIAALRPSLPKLQYILLADSDQDQDETVLSLPRLLGAASPEFIIPPTDPEDMALLHFTSGTTGKPKGAVHVHNAVLTHYLTGKYVLDLHPEDIFWCTADCGWVTGTSYGIIAPLVHGVTNLVYEADFEAERWCRTLAEQQINVWYTAPTAIRMLMRSGLKPREKFDLSQLRLVHSVGEPLNPEAVVWGEEALGLPIHDNWWQTETGGIMIANYAAMEIRPGSMGRPLPGIEAAIVHQLAKGKIELETQADCEGDLALKAGWPSMFRGYLHDDERYRNCFVDDWYITGDLAQRDADGYFWFVGRADDIIKTSGHMVGPFEVESALMEHPAVAEVGVIGKPEPMIGELVKAFISLKPGFEANEQLRLELLGFARKKLGSAVAPKEIAFTDNLPKTRSGKIMRRLLKARELGLPEGDTSTLEG